MLNAEERLIVAAESAQHGDLALLDAHDGSKPGVSHGGRAVAEKALAWLIHSVAASRAAFVCKLDDATMPESTREYPRPPEVTLTRLDDDTMPHLPNLARSSALQARRARPDSLHSGAP